jgi:hypothetical protein
MSKIDKKKLTRGTKLTTQHIWDNNLDGVISNINNANTVGQDGMIQPQYQKGMGTFRITWTLPKLTSRWTRNNGPNLIWTDVTSTGNTQHVTSRTAAEPYIIPFVLPPLQEFMNFEGRGELDTPQIYLTEFSFGFDQRGEGAFITDEDCGPGTTPAPTGAGSSSKIWGDYIRQNAALGVTPLHAAQEFQVNGNHGKLVYDIANRGPLKFSIMSKTMNYFAHSGALIDHGPTDTLYDLEVPMAAFIGTKLRLNPTIEDGLNIYMDPYKTYMIGIVPPQLHDTNISATSTQDNLALINLTINLKFEHRLVDRDAYVLGSSEIPINLPIKHAGRKTKTTYALTKPAVDTTIEADTADGLNTTTTAIDQIFHDKLRSGYDISSDVPPKEELCQDSGYDIIAIPLWNNLNGNIGTMRTGILGELPYHCGGWLNSATVGGAGGASQTGISMKDGPMTRAIVPVDYPFTIHHAFLAMNCFTANFQANGSSAGGGYVNGNTEHMVWDAWDKAKDQYPKPCFDPLAANNSNPVTEIGLGVGTGLRGAQYGYRQVFHYTGLELNKNADTAYMMDRITMPYFCLRDFKSATGLVQEPSWRIYNLPLNGIAGAGAGKGEGFITTAGLPVTTTAGQAVAQDLPHFVGRSYATRDAGNVPVGDPMTIATQEGTSVRTGDDTVPLPSPPGAPLAVLSEDQWLEVRWKTTLEADSTGGLVGWDQVGEFGVNTASTLSDSKIMHGVGGHWLYLVIKKTVVSNANFQNINLKGGVK